MKRLAPILLLSLLLLAQTATQQATLRTPAGDKPVSKVQRSSRTVITLSAPVDYAIVKEANAYVVHFKTPIKPPFGEQSFEDPNVQKAAFAGNDLRLQLTAPDVIGDAYKLDNPFRIVLDLRKGAAPAPGVVPPT